MMASSCGAYVLLPRKFHLKRELLFVFLYVHQNSVFHIQRFCVIILRNLGKWTEA